MCDNVRHEHWVTPQNSRHLTCKQVTLHPGESMPDHSTGPGREEVITCLNGSLKVRINGKIEELHFADSIFIPEDTLHSVSNESEEDASYVFVVTRKRPDPQWRGQGLAETRGMR